MIKMIRSIGIQSDTMFLASFLSIFGSIAIWFLTNRGAEDRAQSERSAIFVGLWAPTFWIVGNSMKEVELAETKID